jgi:hypothetical protein
VFAVGPDEFFDTVTRTDEFTDWWSWLRRCDIEGVYPGARAACLIQAPLPYALRLTIEVEQVVRGALIATHVTGDLRGPARLELEPHADGCRARLVWSLELCDPMLRSLSYVARPAMAWAHDRVVAAGVAEFERRALLRKPG